jgi:hypothetical protein
MSMTEKKTTKAALDAIFLGVEMLREAYSNKRNFTIDGRLVGDIGEVVAERDYLLELDADSAAKHEGVTPDGTRVQIKATFKNKLTFKGGEGLYLGLKLHRDGTYEEIFNGPAKEISAKFSHRKGIDSALLSLSAKALHKLSKHLKDHPKVQRRDHQTG